jgi:hypothetical protein
VFPEISSKSNKKLIRRPLTLPAAAGAWPMSALPPKADIAECDWDVSFVPKAALSRRSKNTLFDNLVGGREQRRRHRQAKRPCSLEVDGQFEFCRLLDRQIGWADAF